MVKFRAMNKAIERYLAKRGIHTTVTPLSERTFTEREPEFFAWFHHSVLGLDTEEYRRKFWREAYRTGRTLGHVPHTLDDYLSNRRAIYRQEMFNIFIYALFMGGSFAVWVMRRQIDKHIRRLKRPGYYEDELSRRKELAEERRKIRRRTTLNSCPTPDALKDAFARAKDSPADMIRFGSLIEDLECHVDNSIVFDECGNIAGRKGGIRQHLANNVPELFERYKTVMRYKALSKKFRQTLGVKDPIPAAMLLPENDAEPNEGDADFAESCKKPVESNGYSDEGAKKLARNASKPELEAFREFTSVGNLKGLRERAGVLLSRCEGTCVSLMAVLEVRINPDYTPKNNQDSVSRSNQDNTICNQHCVSRKNIDGEPRKVVG